MRIANITKNTLKPIVLIIASILLIFIISILIYSKYQITNNTQKWGGFNGERAFLDVIKQMEFGARIPGSTAHDQTTDYISQQLNKAGWLVQRQEEIYRGKQVINIIATRGNHQTEEKAEWIIIGAHYDSRIKADRDPDIHKRSEPVPGANDGASGVGVLLELARVLPEDLDKNIWLVFFDAEDNANITTWEGIMGSREFVKSLIELPDAVVILDMIGDADLNIFIERNSDFSLVTSIWRTAASLGYSNYFIPLPKHSIIDDHTPFLNEGIPAVDIIDFDYPYWHTTQDTIDKITPKSLQIVGEVVYTWITTRE
jgi:Zn-dependent M28 family amino/carboxypeptidase